jgi:hypothetical protein
MQANSDGGAMILVVEIGIRLVQKMTQRRAIPHALVLIAALAAAGPARGQESFVREADFASGRPLLSVLGSGIGTRPASLVMEFACPGPEVTVVDLRGAVFPDGAPITLDLGGGPSGWHEVRLVGVQRPEADWLRLQLDDASFRTALARARAEGAAAVLQVGGGLGVAVGLDALAREMGELARDCAAPRRAERAAATGPLARSAR